MSKAKTIQLYAVIRKSAIPMLGEFIDFDTLSDVPEKCMRYATDYNKRYPIYDRENPIQRVAVVRICEVKCVLEVAHPLQDPASQPTVEDGVNQKIQLLADSLEKMKIPKEPA